MLDRERRVVAVNVVSHALTHIAELTFPGTALLVLQDFFGRQEKYADLGRATFVSAFLFGLAALPGGWLVDRLGSGRVLLIFLFGSATAFLSLAAMPNFWAFTAALGALGFFAGLYHPAGTTMISLSVREQGKAMGAHGMGGNFGLAATPFLSAALGQAVGWRAAYALLALLPMGMGFYLLFRREFAELGKKTRGSGRGVPAFPKEKEVGKNPPPDYRKGPLLLLLLVAVFNGMAYRGFLTFFPVYFAESVKLSWLALPPVTLGGVLTTAVLLLGVLGQMTGGFLADLWPKEKLYAAIFFLAAPLLLSLALLQNLPLIFSAAAFAFLYFMSQPVANSITPRYTSARVRGSIFGIFFFVGFSTGSVMSWIAGAIGEKFHLHTIFFVLAASLLAAALSAAALAVAGRRKIW